MSKTHGIGQSEQDSQDVLTGRLSRHPETGHVGRVHRKTCQVESAGERNIQGIGEGRRGQLLASESACVARGRQACRQENKTSSVETHANTFERGSAQTHGLGGFQVVTTDF